MSCRNPISEKLQFRSNQTTRLITSHFPISTAFFLIKKSQGSHYLWHNLLTPAGVRLRQNKTFCHWPQNSACCCSIQLISLVLLYIFGNNLDCLGFCKVPQELPFSNENKCCQFSLPFKNKNCCRSQGTIFRKTVGIFPSSGNN